MQDIVEISWYLILNAMARHTLDDKKEIKYNRISFLYYNS